LSRQCESLKRWTPPAASADVIGIVDGRFAPGWVSALRTGPEIVGEEVNTCGGLKGRATAAYGWACSG
jgi:hypothetical protein